MWIGTRPGDGSLLKSGWLRPSTSSYPVPALPAGQTLYARIYTGVASGWGNYQDITFTTAERSRSRPRPRTARTHQPADRDRRRANPPPPGCDDCCDSSPTFTDTAVPGNLSRRGDGKSSQLRLRRNQRRAMAVVKNGLGDTAEDRALDGVEPASAADDQGGVKLVGGLDDRQPHGYLGLLSASFGIPASLPSRARPLFGGLTGSGFLPPVQVALIRGRMTCRPARY